MLAALEAVDLVVVFEEDTPLELIKRVRPAALVKGADYRIDQVVGREVVEEGGGSLLLVSLVPGQSTTGLVHRTGRIRPAKSSTCSNRTAPASPTASKSATSFMWTMRWPWCAGCWRRRPCRVSSMSASEKRGASAIS